MAIGNSTKEEIDMDTPITLEFKNALSMHRTTTPGQDGIIHEMMSKILSY